MWYSALKYTNLVTFAVINVRLISYNVMACHSPRNWQQDHEAIAKLITAGTVPRFPKLGLRSKEKMGTVRLDRHVTRRENETRG